MNIDELTLGQVKEIKNMIGENRSNGMLQNYVGKYVICRSRNEGINSGTVKMIDETGLVLSDARRLWFHKTSNESSWYEGVANNGLSNDSKISEPVEKVIIENYSLTICSEKAIKNLKAANSHES